VRRKAIGCWLSGAGSALVLVISGSPALANPIQDFGVRVNFGFAQEVRANDKVETLFSIYDANLVPEELDFSGKVQINDCNKGNPNQCFRFLELKGDFEGLLSSSEDVQLTFWGEYKGLTPSNLAGGSGANVEPYQFTGIKVLWPDASAGRQEQFVDVWFLPDGGSLHSDQGHGRIEFRLQTGYVPSSTCFAAAGTETSTRIPAGNTCVVSQLGRIAGVDATNSNQGFEYLLIEPNSTLQIGLDANDASDFVITGAAGSGFHFELEGGRVLSGGAAGTGIDARALTGSLVFEAEEDGDFQSRLELGKYLGSQGSDEIFLEDQSQFVVAGTIDLGAGSNEVDVLEGSLFQANTFTSTGTAFLYNGASGAGAGIRLASISFGAGDDEIDNLGDFEVTGAVTLGAGDDRVDNFAGHTFLAGSIDLGSGADLLENAGEMTIAGAITNPGGIDQLYNSLGRLKVGLIKDTNGAQTTLNVESGTVEFSQAGSDFHRAIVSSLGTMDLGGNSAAISAMELKGGSLGSAAEDASGVVQLSRVLANNARIQDGSLSGTLTANGGVLSNVSQTVGGNLTINVEAGRTFIREMSAGTTLGTVTVNGGQLWAVDDDTVTATNLTLNSSTQAPKDPPRGVGLPGAVNPGLVLGIGDKDRWAMEVTGTFTHTKGNVFVFTGTPDREADLNGIWNVLNFSTAVDYGKLFSSTYVMTVNPDGSDYAVAKFGADGQPEDNRALTREVSLLQGSLRILVGGVNPNLKGPDLGFGSGACRGVKGEKGVPQAIAGQFPLMSATHLGDLVCATMLPRNPEGPGRSLASYNTLLADTIFERTPLRQFQEIGEQAVNAEGSEAQRVADEDAAVQQPLVMADEAITQAHQGQMVIKDQRVVETNSLTAQWAERDGVRGWFRGFGGSSADFISDQDTVYTPFAINSGGGVVGVDVSVSETFQLGGYVNYGNLQLWQQGQSGSGSWQADGWGGGVMADYWTRNFYVQAALGMTGFSGESRREVQRQGALLDGGTAKGTRTAGSMLGAVRIGAPMALGATYLEPQFTATWSGNQQHRFSESGADALVNLTYESYSTNYMQTALGVKAAWPLKRGETALFTPSLRAAWLADWDLSNGPQRMGLSFTGKGYEVASNPDSSHAMGALLEAGLDYSVAQLEGASVKAYLRGGAELWGGNRGAQWRASGGVTVQF